MIDPGIVFKDIQIRAPSTREAFSASWHVPLNLPYFQGHFPGQPILPAVGIVDATLHTLRVHLQSPSLQLVGIATAKFLSPVLPDSEITLQFQKRTVSDWDCEWTERERRKPLAILRIATS